MSFYTYSNLATHMLRSKLDDLVHVLLDAAGDVLRQRLRHISASVTCRAQVGPQRSSLITVVPRTEDRVRTQNDGQREGASGHQL